MCLLVLAILAQHHVKQLLTNAAHHAQFVAMMVAMLIQAGINKKRFFRDNIEEPCLYKTYTIE